VNQYQHFMPLSNDHLRAVTNYAAEYIRTWCCGTSAPTARVLLAAGRGPARVITCQCILEQIPGRSCRIAGARAPVLARAVQASTSSCRRFGGKEVAPAQLAGALPGHSHDAAHLRRREPTTRSNRWLGALWAALVQIARWPSLRSVRVHSWNLTAPG
jgi:hypothetical protein